MCEKILVTISVSVLAGFLTGLFWVAVYATITAYRNRKGGNNEQSNY